MNRNTWPFTTQKATYCTLKGHLLEYKRWPFAKHWMPTGYATSLPIPFHTPVMWCSHAANAALAGSMAGGDNPHTVWRYASATDIVVCLLHFLGHLPDNLFYRMTNQAHYKLVGEIAFEFHRYPVFLV